MSESSIGPDLLAGAAAYAGAALMATEVATVLSAVAATLPSGAAAVVGVTDATLILTTICDPIAFFQEAQRWQDVAKYAAMWTEGIPTTMNAFGDAWKGPAADAFVAFFNNNLNPVFPALSSLAACERDLLLAAAQIILGAIVTVTVPTAALTVIALSLLGAAPATLGATLVAQWPATAAWAVIITGAATFFIKTFMDLNSAFNKIEIEAAKLSVRVNGPTGDLGNNRLQPPEVALPPLGDDITTLAQMADSFVPESE